MRTLEAKGSALRLQQGKGRRVKHCAEAAGGAIVDSTGGGPLPSSSSVDRLIRVCRDNGGVRGQVGEGSRLEASVAEKVEGSSGSGGVRGQMLRHPAGERRRGRSQAHGLGVHQASQPRMRSRLRARAQPHCGDQVRHGANTSRLPLR